MLVSTLAWANTISCNAHASFREQAKRESHYDVRDRWLSQIPTFHADSTEEYVDSHTLKEEGR